MRRFINETRKDCGITLVALVVTIIVLIILAGVSISLILGNEGLIEKAKNAKVNYTNAAAEEASELDQLETEINSRIE